MADIGGTWKVTFTSDSGGVTMAIGMFEQEGNHLSGTFLTNTGDYRFLEGEVNGSCQPSTVLTPFCLPENLTAPVATVFSVRGSIGRNNSTWSEIILSSWMIRTC